MNDRMVQVYAKVVSFMKKQEPSPSRAETFDPITKSFELEDTGLRF